MPARRTLLYLAHDFPLPVSSAARLRTYNWILHFSKYFEVTLVAPARRIPEPAYLEALAPYCAEVVAPPLEPENFESSPLRRALSLRALASRVRAEVGWLMRGSPPEAWYLQHGKPRAALERVSRAKRFDVVFAERWTWGRRALAAGSRLVLDAAALQASRRGESLRTSHHLLRRLLAARLAASLVRAEERAVRSAALVLTADPAGKRRIGALRDDATSLILPSGLSTHYFAPRRTMVDPSNVLFFGSLESPAQRDALWRLYREMMPRVRRRLRHARLTVVGDERYVHLTRQPGDALLGFTGGLDDEREAMWQAAVAAMPLRFGAGSPQRVAQLLAMGIPVVLTPQAALGLDLRSGDGLLIAPDGEEFAAALTAVLTDTSLRDDLSRRGRQVAETQLSLEATYEKVAALLARDLHAA